MPASPTFTAFQNDRRIAAGPREAIVAALRVAPADAPVLVFDDATGAQIDFDVREGAPAEGRAPAVDEPARGRGRPRLGVTAREVTLLPRHWAWLSAQPGGASVTLRRLVEEASRSPTERARAASNAAYAFLQAIAGDRPGYEEALRALFARQQAAFEAHMASWPPDIRAHALRLAFQS